MKIVLAPNAFKECLSAPKVTAAMAHGVQNVLPDADVRLVPLADGGDGTVEALVSARQGTYEEFSAMDPLMRPVAVQIGLIDGGKTAVIEMAAASGLWRLQANEKNPLKTTTYGTGEMIRFALDRSVDTIILGIGGSATTDGGIGMAAALGYRFLDSDDCELEPVGGALNSIASIDYTAVDPRLKTVRILVACDVTNPLVGTQGAAPVYGPQKGATPEMVPILSQGLENLSTCWQKEFQLDLAEMPGGGAAGGLGAGLVAFCGAQLQSGFDLIADYAHLDEALQGADLIFTGEGKIDASTAFGKVPAGVGRRAQQFGVPVVVLAGAITGDISQLHEMGITAGFPIVRGPMSLAASIEQAEWSIAQTVEQIIRLWIAKSSENSLY